VEIQDAVHEWRGRCGEAECTQENGRPALEAMVLDKFMLLNEGQEPKPTYCRDVVSREIREVWKIIDPKKQTTKLKKCERLEMKHPNVQHSWPFTKPTTVTPSSQTSHLPSQQQWHHSIQAKEKYEYDPVKAKVHNAKHSAIRQQKKAEKDAEWRKQNKKPEDEEDKTLD
jgi:hypothetical protein